MSDAHFHHMQRSVILKGDVAAMRKLLDDGMSANFNFDKEMCDPILVHAARRGAHDICQLLLDSGADVDLGNHFGMRAIDFAARDDDVDLLSMLLRAGASIGPRKRNGVTVLHEAARFSARRAAQLLLERGAHVDAQDDRGNTPLGRCAHGKGLEMAKMLLLAGADPNAESADQTTPFHRVVSGDSMAPPEKIVMFAEFGAQVAYMPKEPGATYLTPFQSVISECLEKRARQLFDLSPQDPDQKTAGGKSLRELVEGKPRMALLLNAMATDYAVRQQIEAGAFASSPAAPRDAALFPL